MTTTKLQQRILRRELHSPRSGLAITVAVVLIVLCFYLGTEIVLLMLGQPALLIAPPQVNTLVPDLDAVAMEPVIGSGIVLAVLGVVLLIAAITPGRRPRHQLPASRAMVVADDTVIASALARQAAHAGNTHPDNVTVRVSQHRAVVHLTPTSGIPVQRDAVTTAVQEHLDTFAASPELKLTVVIADSGKVGQ